MAAHCLGSMSKRSLRVRSATSSTRSEQLQVRCSEMQTEIPAVEQLTLGRCAATLAGERPASTRSPLNCSILECGQERKGKDQTAWETPSSTQRHKKRFCLVETRPALSNRRRTPPQ